MSLTERRSSLSLHSYAPGEWRPPIVKTVAITGAGVGELWETIVDFREHQDGGGVRRRPAQGECRLRELVAQRFMEWLDRDILLAGEWETIVGRIAAREIDPDGAADAMLERALAAGGADRSAI